MIKKLAQCQSVAVVGLGKTGLSVVRFLSTLNKRVIALDDADNPACLAMVQHTLGKDQVVVGSYSESLLMSVDLIVVSPGVDLNQPIFQRLQARGQSICGDVELFCQVNSVPLITITGSNGKTTLTTMVVETLGKAGFTVCAAGNFGLPVLDLCFRDDLDYVVLEISSFQLETTYSLFSSVAVLLNCTPDHLDRHRTFEHYFNLKLSVFNRCGYAIVNSDIPLPHQSLEQAHFTFSATSNATDFYLQRSDSNQVVCFREQPIASVASWVLQGAHHYENALALLAIVRALGISFSIALSVLNSFSGVEHRCQRVCEHDGVTWYNDSKATNEGATIAAIKTLSSQCDGKLIVLLGGDSKGCDFNQLSEVVTGVVSLAVIFGSSAAVLEKKLTSRVAVFRVSSLENAVRVAKTHARSGDFVVLSPACASYDMFNDYQHRGAEFVRCINEVVDV